MKVVLALAVLCFVAALTNGENCTISTDCHHVSCPENNYDKHCLETVCTCLHRHGPPGGGTPCTSKADCPPDTCHHLDAAHDSHCVDGTCNCGLPHGHNHPGGPVHPGPGGP